MEFFIQNENILKFDTKQGTLVQVTNFQRKEKEKVEEKESFEKSAKIISIYSGSRAKKNWNKAKADENKSDFQNPIIMVKILLKV
jgi:hypothetical protein